METTNFITIPLVLLAIIILVQFFKNLKKTQDEIKALIKQRFSGKTIYLQDPLALHIAQESRGLSQKRGNGNLILTDDELFFAMTCPKMIISIPLNRITEIEKPLRMGGKCIMKKLLKVNFTTETGEKDAFGWHVKELDQWEREILKHKKS